MPRICSEDGCEGELHARGMCHKHYERWRVASGGTRRVKPCRGCGSPIPRTSDRGDIAWYCSVDCRPRCAVVACGKAAHARGLCPAHYQRDRAGDLAASTPLRVYTGRVGGPCTLPECDRPAAKRGWCEPHYRRWMRCSDFLTGVPIRDYSRGPLDKACEVLGCDTPRHVGSSLCARHQRQMRVHGAIQPMTAACERCGSIIDFLETLPSGRRRHSHRRRCERCRRRRLATTVEDLISRDGAACHLCHSGVAMEETFPHPLSGSRDHVVPYSLGGSDEPSNLRLAHLICNLRRGNRPLPIVLPAPTLDVR